MPKCPSTQINEMLARKTIIIAEAEQSWGNAEVLPFKKEVSRCEEQDHYILRRCRSLETMLVLTLQRNSNYSPVNTSGAAATPPPTQNASFQLYVHHSI